MASLGPIETPENSHPTGYQFATLHVIVFSAKVLANTKNKIPTDKIIFIFFFRLSSSISKRVVSQTDLKLLSIDA